MSPTAHGPEDARELQVEFAPIHRSVLLSESQTLLGVLQEAIETVTRQGDGDSAYIATKNGEVAVMSRAISELQSAPADQPVTLVLPDRMMLTLVHGAADYAVELLQRQLERPKPGTPVEEPADLRYDAEAVQAWTDTFIAVSERVSNA